MSDNKELTKAEQEALRAPVDVVASKPFEYKGDEVKEGDKITVTKAQAELLKARGSIK